METAISDINTKLAAATVGIAGLGGLGSTVAAALVRAGIGRLILIDFDIVESSNLNRQHYFANQVGQKKVYASLENLRLINPQAQLEGHDLKLTADNLLGIFSQADIIAECFDKADQKQMIVETILAKTDKQIVSASGLAGYGSSNSIVTKKISDRFVLVGDDESCVSHTPFLTAARVWIAACHQAKCDHRNDRRKD